MEEVRVGVVGLGNQGSFYVRDLFEKGEIPSARVTALCDINPAKIEAAKGWLGREDVAFFTDYKQMLDSGLCDLVLVETPHYIHPEIVMECLRRDIHVVCDKPAGVYTKQVREMNEAAKKSKAKFGMMFNQRTNCIYRKMREIIQSGGIGKLQRVNWIITDWFRTQSYYNSGSWRATWSGEGGGVLINQCPHQIDLVQWVVGEMPKTVRGFCQYGRWHDIEVEDEVTAFFEYENGATGVFITTTSEGFAKPALTVVDVETDGKNEQHAGILRNFVNAILGKEELFVEGCDGIAGVELMNAIELSGWNGGETITLPVDEERYLQELDNHRKTSRVKNVDDSRVADTKGTF